MRNIVTTAAFAAALAWPAVATVQGALAPETGPASAAFVMEKTSLGPYSESLPGARFSDDGRHCLRAVPERGAKAGDRSRYAIYLDEKPLGEYEDAKELKLGPDGVHWAVLLRSGAQTIVVADGQASKPYDEVSVAVHPGGVAYFARTDKKWSVGAGGKTFGEYDEVVGMALAPNGRCCFWAKTGEQGQLIVDGKPYAGGRIGWSALSPDGRHVAYLVKDGGKYTVILDGRKFGPYEDMWEDNIQFTPDSAHLVFPAKQGGKWMVVTDGKPSAGCDAVGYVTFGSDGKHIAYCARSGGQWSVIVDGKPVSAFAAPAGSQAAELTLSPDGKRTAYRLGSDGKVAAIVDGKKGPEFDRIMTWDGYGTFFFSSDSKHVGYLGCRDVGEKTTSIIVHDGQEDPPYDAVGVPMFLNDGRCCYWAEKGKQHFAVIAGKPEGPYDSLPYITSDGTHWAYTAAVKNKQYVVMDSRKGPEFQIVKEVAFSPDGRHFAYIARNGDRQITMLDGEPAEETFDSGKLMWRCEKLRFNADGSLEYLAVQGETLYRVKHAPRK